MPEGQQPSDGELLNKVIQKTQEKIAKQPLGQSEDAMGNALGSSRTEHPDKTLRTIAGVEEGREQSKAVVDRVLQEDRAKRAEQQQLVAEAKADPRHQQAIDRAQQENPVGKQDSTPKHKGVRGALHRGVARVKGLVGRNK